MPDTHPEAEIRAVLDEHEDAELVGLELIRSVAEGHAL